MTKKKIISSYGLAFAEPRDMENLRKKSKKGWHVKRFKLFGYELEQGQKEDVIYSIDYRTLSAQEAEEYFEMFAFSGWTHVCSSYDMHLFKANPGTTPIYSDRSSTIDKFTRQGKYIKSVALFFTIVSTILWAGFAIGPQVTEAFFSFTFTCSTVITIPAIMTLGAVQFHKWKEYKRIE